MYVAVSFANLQTSNIFITSCQQNLLIIANDKSYNQSRVGPIFVVALGAS